MALENAKTLLLCPPLLERDARGRRFLSWLSLLPPAPLDGDLDDDLVPVRECISVFATAIAFGWAGTGTKPNVVTGFGIDRQED